MTTTRELNAHERATLQQYWHLKNLVEGHSVMLEEYARGMIAQEEQHCGEVDRMLRKPGELTPVVQGLMG